MPNLTKNQEWGFFGTLKTYGFSDRKCHTVFNTVAKHIAKATDTTEEEAAWFLDGRPGRHLVDDMSFFGLDEKSSIKTILDAFTCSWVKWLKTDWARQLKEAIHDRQTKNI